MAELLSCPKIGYRTIFIFSRVTIKKCRLTLRINHTKQRCYWIRYWLLRLQWGLNLQSVKNNIWQIYINLRKPKYNIRWNVDIRAIGISESVLSKIDWFNSTWNIRVWSKMNTNWLYLIKGRYRKKIAEVFPYLIWDLIPNIIMPSIFATSVSNLI